MNKKKSQRLNTNFSNEAFEKLDNFINNSYGSIKNRNDVLEYLVLNYIDEIELIELLKYIWEKNNTKSKPISENNNKKREVKNTDNFKENLKKQAKSLDLK